MNDIITMAEERELLAEETNDDEERRMLLLEAAEFYITASNGCHPKQASAFVKRAKECYVKSQEKKSAITPVIIETKKVSFDDVVGLEKVKEKIRLKIIEPFRHPELYSYFGKDVGGGILMYGPPGCGKTLLAEAAAHEAGCTFFSISMAGIASKYVGETEKNISSLFAQAREAAPSIIFFDEIESLGGERSHSSEYARTAVSQLLTEINGFGNKAHRILLIGATNEPWSVDIALRRSGRFGDHLFIPPLDFKARYKLLKQHLKEKPLADDVNIIALAIETKAYSGADIVALCDDAIEHALTDSLAMRKPRKVNMEDFISALSERHATSTIQWFRMALAELEKNNDESFHEVIEYGRKLLAAT